MSTDVLVVAAHGDDEVLGAGGSLFSHAEQGDRVHLIVFSDADSSRHPSAPEAAVSRRQAIHAAAEVLGIASVHIGTVPDCRFDTVPQIEFVREIEAAIERHRPSVVYTHSVADLNADHRIIARATATACRPCRAGVQELLSYEVRSSTDWGEASGVVEAFRPTHWNVLRETAVKAKLRALECYGAELREWPHSRSTAAIEALVAHRGAQVFADAAEAFQTLRVVRRFRDPSHCSVAHSGAGEIDAEDVGGGRPADSHR